MFHNAPKTVTVFNVFGFALNIECDVFYVRCLVVDKASIGVIINNIGDNFLVADKPRLCRDKSEA